MGCLWKSKKDGKQEWQKEKSLSEKEEKKKKKKSGGEGREGAENEKAGTIWASTERHSKGSFKHTP